MAQPNLLQRAKQGDADAIAALMNLTLQDKGIATKVVRIQDYLHISFIAANPLNQTTLTDFARQGLERLAAESIQTVKVYGLKTDEALPNWVATFQLGTDCSEAEPSGAVQSLWGRVGLDRFGLQPLHDRWTALRPAIQTAIPRLNQSLTVARAKGQALLNSARSRPLRLPTVQEMLPPGISVAGYGAIASLVTVGAFLVGGMVAGIAISHGEKTASPRDRSAATAIAKAAKATSAQQQAEVKQYLSKMMEAQTLFYQQNLRWAKNLEELERSAAVVSHSYSYTYRVTTATPTQFQLVAIAKAPELKSYVAITALLPNGEASGLVVSRVCETLLPTQVPPIVSASSGSASSGSASSGSEIPCPTGSAKVR